MRFFAEANTTYGKIGCKVWIFRGEVLPETAENKLAGRAPSSKAAGAPRATSPAVPSSGSSTPAPVQ